MACQLIAVAFLFLGFGVGVTAAPHDSFDSNLKPVPPLKPLPLAKPADPRPQVDDKPTEPVQDPEKNRDDHKRRPHRPPIPYGVIVVPTAIYGALAVDRDDVTRFGYVYRYSSQEAADNGARIECGWPRNQCTVVMRFTSGVCIAYYVDSAGKAAGWGWSANAGMAENIATDACQAHGAKSACIPRIVQCIQ